ncbi:MAG TPA: T9SS type A sorting domain-containing protein [Candidatus Eisenbacteria bacterium]|nr:T9SS type A sorting domain-containing protein [Candidatus Eisenbacteria bacterium]
MAQLPPTLAPGDRYHFVGTNPEAVTSDNCGPVNGCGVEFGDLGVESPRMYVASAVNVGVVGVTRFATGRMLDPFKVAPGSSNRITAKLIGVVRWRGFLQADFGAYDNTTSIQLDAAIYDVTDAVGASGRRLVGRQTLHTSSVGGSLSLPPVPNYIRDIGSAGVDLVVDVERGRDYLVAIEATSTSTSGLVGILAVNSFANISGGGAGLIDGFIERTSLAITLEPDYLAEIDSLRSEFRSSIDSLRAEFRGHQHEYLTGRGAGHNNTEATTSPPLGVDGDDPGAAARFVGADRRVAPPGIGGPQLGLGRVDPPRFDLEGSRTNPASDGMLVRFTLPGGEPATLELFDVAGRLVMTREVGSMGAGAHQVELAPSNRLANGVYLIRLMQAGQTRSTRVTVLE